MKNYFEKKSMSVYTAALILIVIPSLIWIALGLSICYYYSFGIYQIYAVLFPPFIILNTYFAARRYHLPGGLILITEGLFMIYLFSTFFSLTLNIVMIITFAAPITWSGFIISTSNGRSKATSLSI